MLRRRLDALLLRAGEGRPLRRLRPWLQMLDRFCYASAGRNRSAPFARDVVSVHSMANNLVIATLPCWLIGLWSLGHQSSLAMAALELTQLPGWRGALLAGAGIGYDPRNAFACIAHGLSYFLPVFLVALAVGSIWDALFAELRGRPVDEGLLSFAWLFTLILPAGVPLYQAALGMTFGMVVGKHVFGGSGRYLVNPAVLGVTFLLFAYPDLVFGAGAWVPVPGFTAALPLPLAGAGGVAALLDAGWTWRDLFIGMAPGAIGTPSVLGCVIGAAWLIWTDTVSWRVMLGALLGMIATVFVFNGSAGSANTVFDIPWAWHLVLGGLAFGIVFLATDPVAGAMTDAGRWIFGALTGLLAIVIRVTNPSHGEGILFAILLASLFAPVIDFVVVELNIRRRRRRLAETADG